MITHFKHILSGHKLMKLVLQQEQSFWCSGSRQYCDMALSGRCRYWQEKIVFCSLQRLFGHWVHMKSLCALLMVKVEEKHFFSKRTLTWELCRYVRALAHLFFSHLKDISVRIKWNQQDKDTWCYFLFLSTDHFHKCYWSPWGEETITIVQG